MKESSKEKAIQKHLAKVKSKRTIKEERMVSLDFFSHLTDKDVAVPALLSRFDYSIEHGIQDEREKAVALEGITRFGPDAVDIIKSHLKETTKIAWPLKILTKVCTPDQVRDVIKDALFFGETSFDIYKLEKNYDLLCYLRDYQTPDFIDKIAFFIDNPDERIRCAAVDCLVEQEEKQEEIQALVEKFLWDDSAENIRVRETVLDCYIEKKWRVKDLSHFVDGIVAPGVTVNKQGELKQNTQVRGY